MSDGNSVEEDGDRRIHSRKSRDARIVGVQAGDADAGSKVTGLQIRARALVCREQWTRRDPLFSAARRTFFFLLVLLTSPTAIWQLDSCGASTRPGGERQWQRPTSGRVLPWHVLGETRVARGTAGGGRSSKRERMTKIYRAETERDDELTRTTKTEENVGSGLVRGLARDAAVTRWLPALCAGRPYAFSRYPGTGF